jgi:hypothetical protein
MTYHIAIPSYHRAETLAYKTLNYLLRTNVPPDRITVFVSDEDQKKAYAEAFQRIHKDDLPSGIKIVVAVPGMRAVRNFIQKYYEEGELVFNLDDDLDRISRKVDDKKIVEEEDLHSMIVHGFNEAERRGARLWGIYPVDNPYWMKAKISVGLFYIEGAVWGFRNSHSKDYSVTLEDKEDFERSIKCFLADGCVVRLNKWSMTTKFYREPGGMQQDGKRTLKRISDSAKDLLFRYPGLCVANTQKKSEFPEIRLINPRPL